MRFAAGNQCIEHQSCKDCLKASGCGWCETSKKCVRGSTVEPCGANCTSWHPVFCEGHFCLCSLYLFISLNRQFMCRSSWMLIVFVGPVLWLVCKRPDVCGGDCLWTFVWGMRRVEQGYLSKSQRRWAGRTIYPLCRRRIDFIKNNFDPEFISITFRKCRIHGQSSFLKFGQNV